jgi:hypothetical protein
MVSISLSVSLIDAFAGLMSFGSIDDNHTTLGRTLLPQTLTSLLKSSLEGSPIPSPARTSAVFEILRIGANLCMDHGKSQITLIYLRPFNAFFR